MSFFQGLWEIFGQLSEQHPVIAGALAGAAGAIFGSFLSELAKRRAIGASIDRVEGKIEQLKADIQQGVWDRQTRWAFKRDMYLKILEYQAEMVTALRNYALLLETPQTRWTELERKRLEAMSEQLRLLQLEGSKISVSAGLIVSFEALRVLELGAKLGPYARPSELRALGEELTTASHQIIEIGRRELGIEPLTSAPDDMR